jgi:hypothetical protein
VFSGKQISTLVTVSQLYCDSCLGINMPKVKCSDSAKFGHFIHEFHEHISLEMQKSCSANCVKLELQLESVFLCNSTAIQ